MSEPINANDRHIEELLHTLGGGYWGEKHAAIVALVAERNALREQLRLANIDQFNTEAEANDRDRDLRERLVESALRGANVSGLHRSEAELIGKASVWMVDAAIAAMRKGDSDGK